MTVINDILDFSETESGNMELEEQDFELRTVIEEVLDLFATQATQMGLELFYQIDVQAPQIVGDATRLRQVLINLVGNAIKFTEKGEIFVGVRLGQQLEDDQIELLFDVRDTGIGIPPDKLSRLFKAFSQVDSSTTRKYGGTGLGLAISRRLVELMGGSIGVASEVGTGTTFSFSIHVRTGSLTRGTFPRCLMDGSKGRRILVVDDNPTSRTLLKSQLEGRKLVPELAASGYQALELLNRSAPFDLVITDRQMPGMDGLEAARQIRVHPPPQVPVIITMTANALQGDREDCLQAGMDDYIAKPVKLAALVSLLEKVAVRIRNSSR